MEEDDHLVKTFYISKPQIIEEANITPITEIKFESEECEECEVHPLKKRNVHFNTPDIQKEDPKCRKIFKMIKNQLTPSAEIIPKVKSRSKSKNNVSSHKFLAQFQTFFKSFIKTSNLNQEYLRRKSKKPTEKKNTYKYLHFSDSEEETPQNKENIDSDEDSELFVKEEIQRLNYHQRLKQRIQCRVEDATHTVGDRKKIHKVETSKKNTNKTVSDLLREKNKCKKVPPKLKIVRTGLPIRIEQLDPKAKDCASGLAEDHKAKKDMGFYKLLQKNCQIILSQISHYEKGEFLNRGEKKIMSRSRSAARSYTRETVSVSAKKHQFKHARMSMDDEDQQWKSRFQQIEKGYSSNLKKSRKLGSGLRVFEKYCEIVDVKWKKQQHRINTLLSEGPCVSQETFDLTN